MEYRLEFENYTFPESLTYNMFSFRSAVPSAKLPRAHGARVPRGYLAERRIEIRGMLETGWSTETPLQDQIDALRAAVMAGPQTLYLPNDRHLRNVQKDDNGLDRYENTYPERLVDIAIDLITGDPFMYSDAESSDLNNAVDQTPEDVVINNSDGNAPAAPELRLTVDGGGDAGDIPSTSIKGATEFNVTSGSTTWNYACLNGDVMTVYVDKYGDLGLRPVTSGVPGSRPPGICDPVTGFPTAANITTDGQVAPTSNPPTYGLLRSPESRNGQVSTELAVEGRRELVTAGAGNVVCGWSVTGDSVDLQSGSGDNFWHNTEIDFVDFVVSGANAGVALSATSTMMVKDYVSGSGSNDILEVKTIWSFQNAETVLEKTRVKVRVELRNPTGSTLTNVRFAFWVDPNTGLSSGTDGFIFLTSADPDAFAAQAFTGDHILALGIYNTGSNVVGARVGVTNGNTNTTLGTSPIASLGTGANSIELGTGTNADYYAGLTLNESTTNFKTDLNWNARAFSASDAQRALMVLTPEIDIGAGATQVFEFYLFTRIDLQGGDVELDATVENITTGETFTLAGTVPDGTVIKVNSLEETVLIGDDDRTDLFDGLFPSLALGNNTIRITEPNEQISNLDVYWRNRWY